MQFLKKWDGTVRQQTMFTTKQPDCEFLIVKIIDIINNYYLFYI